MSRDEWAVVGEALRKRREDVLGFRSRSEFARSLGLTHDRTLSDVENGRRDNYLASTIRDLERYYDLRSDSLRESLKTGELIDGMARYRAGSQEVTAHREQMEADRLSSVHVQAARYALETAIRAAAGDDELLLAASLEMLTASLRAYLAENQDDGEEVGSHGSSAPTSKPGIVRTTDVTVELDEGRADADATSEPEEELPTAAHPDKGRASKGRQLRRRLGEVGEESQDTSEDE